MQLVVRLLAMMLVIAFSPQVISGIRIGGFTSALVAAVVYSVLALLVGWAVRLVVTLLAIVPGILTFGLFFLLIPIIANAILLKLTAGVLVSFDIRTWSAAFLLSIAVSVVNALFERKRRDERRDEA